MNWSFAEFLNLIDLRGQSWCFVDMGARSGFRILHNEVVYFHALLEGTARITLSTGQPIDLKPGDVAIVLSGDAHKIRNRSGSTIADQIDLLSRGQYVDTPPTVRIGKGYLVSRLLCARLKLFWPGGFHPRGNPDFLTIHAPDLGIDLRKFAEAASGAGAASLLTRMAALLFVTAFRNHDRCRAQFRLDLHDPIARAHVLIQWHPFEPWTVESLAHRVGMGRSNFAARFSAQIGHTPIDALTGERMKHAESFLRNTDLKIAEVSERVGYRSEAAFTRRFTAHFGITPGRFRDQARWTIAGEATSPPPA